MRSGMSHHLIVVVLCVCATAAEQPEQFSPGDILIVLAGEPNDPNGAVPPAGEDPAKAWDPATHLVADWESISVSMTSRLYNPATQPEMVTKGPQWSTSLAGIVGIVDSNGLIGLTRSPSSLVALDQDGKVVSRSMAGNSPTERYQRPISLIAPGARPGAIPVSRVTLDLPLDPNAAFPEMFSRIEWTMNVLVAPELKTVDVPFEASDTWLELTPGMEILVEQATAEQGKYEYRIHLRYDSQKVEYMVGGSIHLWRFGVTRRGGSADGCARLRGQAHSQCGRQLVLQGSGQPRRVGQSDHRHSHWQRHVQRVRHGGNHPIYARPWHTRERNQSGPGEHPGAGILKSITTCEETEHGNEGGPERQFCGRLRFYLVTLVSPFLDHDEAAPTAIDLIPCEYEA